MSEYDPKLENGQVTVPSFYAGFGAHPYRAALDDGERLALDPKFQKQDPGLAASLQHKSFDPNEMSWSYQLGKMLHGPMDSALAWGHGNPQGAAGGLGALAGAVGAGGLTALVNRLQGRKALSGSTALAALAGAGAGGAYGYNKMSSYKGDDSEMDLSRIHNFLNQDHSITAAERMQVSRALAGASPGIIAQILSMLESHPGVAAGALIGRLLTGGMGGALMGAGIGALFGGHGQTTSSGGSFYSPVQASPTFYG